MRTSDKTEELFAAIAAFAATVEDASRDAKGQVKGKKDYTYASLDGLLPVLRPKLAEHKLVLVQGIDRSGSDLPLVWLTTRLAHASGQYIETDYPLSVSQDPQATGSALTYAKRYALMAMLALAAPKEDDDGAAGKAVSEGRTPDRRAEPEDVERARRSQHDPEWEEGGRERFMAQIAKLEFTYDEVCEFLSTLKRPRPSSMPADARARLIEYLGSSAGADAYAKFLDSRDNKKEK